MAGHPPWLRFQAYVVGLPKTGSTSLTTVFGRYRSGHEWELMDLVAAGLQRQRGELSDEAFWTATGRRLDPPSLELDSATSHYLYADLLADRFPRAVFLHSVRDVRGWVTSVLDMILRKRLARRHLDLPYSTSESMYLEVMSGGRYDLDPNVLDDDRTSIAPLMRYWAEHMTRMPALLPPERTLVIRTRDIAERLSDLAAHVGVPVDTMRIDLAHANRAPMTFDRFAAFGGDEVRQVYEEHCSAVMAEVFPDEHAAWSPQVSDTATRDWGEYVTALDAWVAEAIELHGMAAAR